MRSWLLVVMLNGGCALFANANAHHNSRGTACLSSPAYGLIDIAVAGVSAAAIGASDASAGYYTIPVVFGASGLLGVVSAARCGGDDDREPAISDAPPASNSAPSFGEAPVDPEARDVTAEEMFGSGSAPRPPPTLDRNGIPATLPPPPAPTPAPAPAAPACTLTPRRDCPDGSYCRLVAENAGECIAIP